MNASRSKDYRTDPFTANEYTTSPDDVTWQQATVPPGSIQVLGQLLQPVNDTAGCLYKALPDNSEWDITPVAPAQRYGFSVRPVKCLLVNQCAATIPTNRSRFELGVGERVNLSLITNPPASASWTTTAGSLSTNSGPATTLTAPSNATSTVTVTLSVADQTVTRDFSVVEPNGYTNASAVGYPDFFSISPAQAAAGMYLKVIIGPTNVSFYRVSIMETGLPGTNNTGYFSPSVNGAPSHIGNGADAPIPLGQDNSWTDHAGGGVYNSPWSGSGWSGGGFRWDIPVVWWIDGSQTNPMTGWNQVFTLGSDGTVTVQKFNHTVIRHVNENYGTITPYP